MKLLIQMLNWFKELISDSNKASTKRFAYLFITIASVTWLSFDLHNHGITDNWALCFQTLIITVVGGYVGGHIVDRTTKEKSKEDVSGGE